MTGPGHSAGSDGGRRRKRFLSPSQKYEIWLALVRGEVSTVEAANRAGVDRSTIVKLRQVGKQGALDAFAASRPGVRHGGRTQSLRRRGRDRQAVGGVERDGRAVDARGGKERWD